MKDKRKKIALSVLGIITLILITVGVTYAVFTYTKLGTTENTVTTGTLKFLYTENTGVGNGISIENAFPVTDEVGKSYSTENYVFDFKVEGTNTGRDEIPYEVTLRKKSDSTLAESNVKVYLTDMTEDSDTEILEPTLYSDLTLTNIDVGSEIEKTIYNGTVAGGELTYLKEFRLRMWIDNNSNQDDINGKTFTALVNVYSNVPLISEEEQNLRSNTEISSITVGDVTMTKVEGQAYDYETTLPEGTTSITINTETVNPNATVKIEKLDSLSYQETSIKRLASSNKVDLVGGDNYFKITVISVNKEETKEYKIKIKVIKTVVLRDEILDKNPLITANPTLTTSSNNTSDASGLYKSTATNDGKPTYYFRGDVKNNYVSFAGFTWRIVRINEDGTVRLIMANGINNNATYKFNSTYSNYTYMYYSNNSNAKLQLNNWYNTNIVNKGYASKVATGDYFCEQAKVKYNSSYTSGNATMEVYSSYAPNFKCETDGNGKGVVNSNVGLITYDEVLFAGGYPFQSNNNYYLYSSTSYWMISSSGITGNLVSSWTVYANGRIDNSGFSSERQLHPVLNIIADTVVTGSGTSTNPWIIV